MANKYIITNDLISFITSHSSYLKKLTELHPYIIEDINKNGWRKTYQNLQKKITNIKPAKITKADLMKQLRVAKAEISLFIALADISEEWNLTQTTNALSEFADLVVEKTLSFLVNDRKKNKFFKTANIDESGIIIIAAGKLGGNELNYSSDIDLVILYKQDCPNYIGSQNVKQFYINLTQEFVSILQQLTGDGYVFRVDLRLRPDPYSTPIAVTLKSAELYYENVGQNWERAAMIKARFICGDKLVAEQYMSFLSKFVWRKYLDFNAIKDIHSIKRQIDSKVDYSPENLLSYDVKLGKGGIREVEFFAQVQQLIWGGREKTLRSKETCKTLKALEEIGRLDNADELIEAYEFFRDVEHRLQMIADEATHELPKKDEDLEDFTKFMGFESRLEFSKKLREYLTLVQKNYANLFIDNPSLSAEGNLVFTGVSNDPETLITLAKMGFENPERICDIMRGWHHGRRRATRLKRVREILTEITPMLLKTVSESNTPDIAFSKFDNFLNELPSGVQIFTLFNEKPELIKLFVEIMGNSPWLAENFGRSPTLATKILSSNFIDPLNDSADLDEELYSQLEDINDEDLKIKTIRRWKHDIEFQVGIRLLKGYMNHEKASKKLSAIAQTVVDKVLEICTKDVKGKIAIIAMGRLGEKQLTFGSDLDLVFVIEPKANESERNYLKIAQKFYKIMTNMSEDGILYPVDTRLRPSGDQGSLVTSLKSFEKYYYESAWSWEFMALTKARPVAGNSGLQNKLKRLITQFLRSYRNHKKLASEMYDMRQKIAAQFSDKNPWHIKYAKGGLFEIDFIIQYFKLTKSIDHPRILATDKNVFWNILKNEKILSDKDINELKDALDFLLKAQGIIRLISLTGFDSKLASKNQKRLIVEHLNGNKFSEVEAELIKKQKIVNENFNKIFKGE